MRASKRHVPVVLGILPLVIVACVSAAKTFTAPTAPVASPSASAPPPAPALVAAVDAGGPPSIDEICAKTPAVHAAGLPGKKPFRDLDPHCPDTDHFCDVVDKTPDPKATCFIANDNIARAEREARNKGAASAAPPMEWDGTKPPKYLDRIQAHFHLTAAEQEALKKNHFVVLDRLPYADYANAFHDVYQEQLPLFVGVDPILHAVFRGTERALERVERKRLLPALKSLVKKLRGSLAATAATMSAETRADLDVYLGVAAALIATTHDPAAKLSVVKGNEETIRKLVELASKEGGELTAVELFGRERMIDFSQMTPRGHYTGNSLSGGESLEDYFRTVMWLSRLELNLVSRSSRSSHPGPTADPRETPREITDALALAELIERSGATTELRAFEEVYTAFAGRREDVSPAKLLELAKQNGLRSSDPTAPDKLKSAIGEGFQRTARTHFTVENAPKLPAIFTMFGPRIVPDVAPLTRVVTDAIPERKRLGAGDVGMVLGHDRAREHIRDLAVFPALPDALKNAREELKKNATGATDIYGSWLRSILAIANKPEGVVPSFTNRPAYSDHRLNSALVGYGQLRHAFVLLAAQGYDAYGCEIPDAYVEPMPAVYDALLAHVRNMKGYAKGWDGLERVLTTLAAIVRDETSGRVLTEPQRRWLAMVAEHIPNGGFVSTGEPPKWTGWYFDMFEDRVHGASKHTGFLADYFTLTNIGEVAYLGAEGPRMGVFIVDTNGEPRAMVGPVAKGFETYAPIAGRLDDEKVFLSSTKKSAPWRASYALPEPPEPAIGLQATVVRCGEVDDPRRALMYQPPDPKPPQPSGPIEWRVAVRSLRPTNGPLTITLLDHHADPLSKPLVLNVTRDWQVGVFDLDATLAKAHFGVEAIHANIMGFDYATSPSVFSGKDLSSREGIPVRPRGPGYFTLGL